MESKRLILAVVFSSLIFLGWNFFSRYMGWLPEPPVQSEQPAGAPEQRPNEAAATDSPAGDPSAPQPRSVFIPAQGRLITVDTPLYKAVLHGEGGVLREFYLKQYRVSIGENAPLVNLVNEAAAGQAPMGLLLDGLPTWKDTVWTLEGDDLTLDAEGTGILRLSAEIQGMRLVRELTFSGANYLIKEDVRIVSPTPRAVKLAFTFAAAAMASDRKPSLISRARYFVFGGEPPVESENQYNLTRVAWFQDGKFKEETSVGDLGKGVLVQGKVSWMGVMNNYFMGAVSMDDESASAKGSYADGIYHVLIGRTGINAAEGNDAAVECVYFLGPKKTTQLAATPNHLNKALDYGMFSFIAKPLVHLLQFLYKYVHNYGVAIILMTMLIKLVFWPLSQKSYRSMQQMKQLQPKIAKIREKHAGDKETLNREIMQLYKTYKVNPAGGCLPILVQIPVFFGLYQALLNAIELRHAPFITHLPFTDNIWLADLASADPYGITPLLMGATMVLQQKLTPTPGDPTQAKIMMLMPIIFTVLFLGFPSGLVIYWLVNNILSIGQQWWLLRRTPG